MKHIPDSLYAKLPFIYVLAGLAVVLLVAHPVAALSGSLLVLAGLAVFYSRLAHRVKKKDMGAYGRCEMAHTCERRQALLDRRGGERRAVMERKAEERRMTERRSAAIDRRSR